MKTSTIAWIVVAVVIVALGLYALDQTYPATYSAIFPMASSTSTTGNPSTGAGQVSLSGSVNYYCDQGQIQATFSASAVQLDLSDGRYFVLPQIASASGSSYETTFDGKDELLQTKGSSASLSENGTATYSDCVAAHITDAGGGYHTYLEQSGAFSFVYPDAFSVVGTPSDTTASWMMGTTTLGMLLAEVQLPATAMPKTNFGGASFTVGSSADPSAVGSCLSAANGAVSAGTVTINGVSFDKFTESSAGAGNLYTTTSYRVERNGTCYAIEDTIHSTQLANYPASAGITAFDQTTVQSELASIVVSFKFLQ